MDFIKRDIPRWDTYSLPEQSNNWYNIYCDLREQTDRSLDADAEIMKKAIDGINDKRALLTPQIIPQNKSHRMAHARPTSKQRSAARDRSLGGRNIGGPLPRESSGWGKKKPNIFQPARRNTALTIPTKALNTRASQVPRAPRALVEEHQESRRPKPTIAAPKHLPPALQHPLLAQNEAKLRALTGNPARADAKPDLKRRATSPPPASSSSSAPSAPFPPQSSGLPSSGPVMRRRPPPSIFMPPKRRRM
jgi:elongin-A